MASTTRLLSGWIVVTLLLSVALVWNGPASAAEGELLESILVFNTEPEPVMSETWLQADHRYRIVASGEISDWTSDASGVVQGEAWGVDPLYCYAKWRCGTPALWRQLLINDVGLDIFLGKPDAMPYRSDHTYRGTFSGVDGPLKLVTYDAVTGSYGDNSGYFKVKIIDLGPAPSFVDFTFEKIARSESRLTRLVAFGDGTLRLPSVPDEGVPVATETITGGNLTFVKSITGPDGTSRDVVEVQPTGAIYRRSDTKVTIQLFGDVVRSTWGFCDVGQRGRFVITEQASEVVSMTLCGRTPFAGSAYTTLRAEVQIDRPEQEPTPAG